MIRDIVVHLTGSPEDEARLHCGETLAGKFDAHLTGLLVHLEPELAVVPEAAYAGVSLELLEEAREATEDRRRRLAPRFANMLVPNDLRVVSGWRSTIGGELASEARVSDLFVGTRPYGDPGREHNVEEGVLFGSGCPCLLLPPGQRLPMVFDTVLVAWKNRREAARALRDANPFLQRARRVVVAMATEEADEETRSSSGTDVARYLSRHGIKPEIRELPGWHAPEDAILNEAKASEAQLIVAGAYGHSRLREWLLGGVTRTLLARSEHPVLMSR